MTVQAAATEATTTNKRPQQHQRQRARLVHRQYFSFELEQITIIQLLLAVARSPASAYWVDRQTDGPAGTVPSGRAHKSIASHPSYSACAGPSGEHRSIARSLVAAFAQRVQESACGRARTRPLQRRGTRHATVAATVNACSIVGWALEIELAAFELMTVEISRDSTGAASARLICVQI